MTADAKLRSWSPHGAGRPGPLVSALSYLIRPRLGEAALLEGVALPKGAVLHLCLGAANRDTERWDDPDAFDPYRTTRPSLAFGGGPHVCIGQHVARAEMSVAINALLDRLPGLRLDPDETPPEIIGFYERGATAIPVRFD